MSKPTLVIGDFRRAAQTLKIEVPTIQSVTKVESGGKGFMPDGRLILRFEPHIFSKYTDAKFDKTNPAVSYPKWVQGYPKSVDHSYQLMAQATKLNAYAAGLSCSYGLFQIMGFNFSTTGAKTFKEFYYEMEKSEAAQLDMFCRYILRAGLDDELQRKDWARFAEAYNGKQYKKNEYDTKLQRWYDYFVRLQSPQRSQVLAFFRQMDENQPLAMAA